MAFTFNAALSLGSSQTGLTLAAALQDTTGTIHATLRDITTGFVEQGAGLYSWVSASIPDGYRGQVVFYVGTLGADTDFDNVTLKSQASIASEEFENTQTGRLPSAAAITNINTVFVTDFAANYSTANTGWATYPRGYYDQGQGSNQAWPNNLADLAITATTGRITVGTNADKAGYSISGTTTTLDALQTAIDSTHGAGSWATATSVTVSDKTGFKLASDGLDLIVPADPSAIPSLGTASIVTWIGYFGMWSTADARSTESAETIRNQAGDVVATHALSDENGVFISGPAT